MTALGPIERRRKLEKAQAAAARAQAKAGDLAESMHELEYTVEKLTEINQALWEIIKESFKLEDEYLTRWVEEIRRRNAEKAKEKSARLCKECGRPLERRQPNCLYCGAQAAADNVFDSL